MKFTASSNQLLWMPPFEPQKRDRGRAETGRDHGRDKGRGGVEPHSIQFNSRERLCERCRKQAAHVFLKGPTETKEKSVS